MIDVFKNAKMVRRQWLFIYLTHNEGKSVANDSKSYFCYWKKIVDKYNNKNLLMLIILL